MRETRSSGSVEGVVGNHDSYSDLYLKWRQPLKLTGHRLARLAERRLAPVRPSSRGKGPRMSSVSLSFSALPALGSILSAKCPDAFPLDQFVGQRNAQRLAAAG